MTAPACGFSCFRQHFALGFDFASDLEDIGFYYRTYVARMAHWDCVLAGQVHRVVYEDPVADTPGEVQRQFAGLGLPFDEACPRPHKTPRAVRTASASQVRQPVYRDVLTSYPAMRPRGLRVAIALRAARPFHPRRARAIMTIALSKARPTCAPTVL